jgi:hypothetical protein
MIEKIKKRFYSWACPWLLEKEARRAEMEKAAQEHWKDYGPIHLYELIREKWEGEFQENHGEEKSKENSKKTKSFIVFIDKDLEVDWITQEQITNASSKAISKAESIGAKPCKHLPQKHQLEFQRLIAQAIVCAVEENIEISEKTAALAQASLGQRITEQSRLWTQQWAIVVLFLVFFSIYKKWSLLASSNMLQWSICGGFLGAYLSTIQNANKGECNSAAGQWVHFVEVASRLISGCVLGGISYAVLLSPLGPSLSPSEKSLSRAHNARA